MPFYGKEKWNPRLVCAQIAAIQFLGYLSFGVLLTGAHWIFQTPVSLAQFFAYYTIDYSTSAGRVVTLITLANSFISAFFLCLIVKRSKKCFDFSATSHLIHLCACYMTYGFPISWSWWVIWITSLVIMTVAGEFFCYRNELSPIRIPDLMSSRRSRASMV